MEMFFFAHGHYIFIWIFLVSKKAKWHRGHGRNDFSAHNHYFFCLNLCSEQSGKKAKDAKGGNARLRQNLISLRVYALLTAWLSTSRCLVCVVRAENDGNVFLSYISKTSSPKLTEHKRLWRKIVAILCLLTPFLIMISDTETWW